MQTDVEKTKEQLIAEIAELRGRITSLESVLEYRTIDEQDVQFTDLISVEELQEIQDAFSRATGVASIITHPDGKPITQPSNFCRLCQGIIRKTEKGLRNCYLSDAVIGRFNPDGPIVQPCLSGGLYDAGASIRIGDRHIANWLIGQVRNEQLNEDRLIEYAREIGADVDEFREALDDVTVMPLEQFKDISHALYLIANQLSQSAYHNILLKNAIEGRKKSDERYRGLFDYMSSGVAVYRPVDNASDFIFVDFNKAAENIEQTPKEQVIGRRVTEVFPGVKDLGLLEVLKRVARQGEPKHHPIAMYRDEKLTGWRENFVFRLSSGDVIAVYDDVTERQQTLERLNASESRFRLLVEQSPLSIEIYDSTGLMIQANRAWEELWNHPRRFEIVGSYNIFTDNSKHHKEIARKVQEAFTGKSFDIPELDFDSSVFGYPGQRHHVHVSIYPLKTGAERVENVVVMYEDIMSRVAYQREREGLIAELELKNAELERFTYTVSHDLKSPLITIRGFIGMIKKDFAAGKLDTIEEDFDRISNAANRMYSLLEDVLHLSRIGRTVSISDRVSLGDLAREVVAIFDAGIREKNIKINISDSLPTVKGDRVRLYEVMQNLVENAVKFINSEKNPTITIGVEKRNGESVCFVRDNGIGIDPRYQEQIFGLFDQLDQNAEGTGVGLALVRRIVETHGGRIWVESDGPGKGSTFYFDIPEK